MLLFSDLFFRKKTLKNLDVFFLTYDEPLKEERWQEIKSSLPSAKWVDGIKGFDRAHKECAQLSKGERLVIIDGDNKLLPSFFNERIDQKLLEKNFVLSWSSINSINSLEYGNGGVKCWDKDVVLKMKTHESSESPRASSDFCFEVPYFQISKSLSVTRVDITPQQAFRAGFREGVKMSLNRGLALSEAEIKEGIEKVLPSNNLFRLKTWMSVGADVKNGVWAILGSRTGFLEVLKREFSLQLLQDHSWIESYWNEVVSPAHHGDSMSCQITNYDWDYKSVYEKVVSIGEEIKEISKVNVPFYNTAQSIYFKRKMINPKRSGLMFEER